MTGMVIVYRNIEYIYGFRRVLVQECPALLVRGGLGLGARAPTRAPLVQPLTGAVVSSAFVRTNVGHTTDIFHPVQNIFISLPPRHLPTFHLHLRAALCAKTRIFGHW